MVLLGGILIKKIWIFFFLSFNLQENAFDAEIVYGGSAVLVQQDQMSIWVMKCRVLCVSAVLQRIVCTS